MKILRIRRGYTTNSSGDSEWVPPPDPQYNRTQPGQLATGNVQVGAPGQDGASAPLFVASPTAKHVTILATQPIAASGTQGARPAASPRAGKGATNLGLVGGLLGAVFLLFVLTAALRRLFGGKE